jgi:hypothetical protein
MNQRTVRPPRSSLGGPLIAVRYQRGHQSERNTFVSPCKASSHFGRPRPGKRCRSRADQAALVRIQDDGKDIDSKVLEPSDHPEHRGLKEIRERAHRIRPRLEFRSERRPTPMSAPFMLAFLSPECGFSRIPKQSDYLLSATNAGSTGAGEMWSR